jgi:hypothetical protein
MLKFKHINILEHLLLESDLIIIGNEANDIISIENDADMLAKLDAFLSMLIEKDIINKSKTDPNVLEQLSQVFLQTRWIKILDKYIDYVSQVLKLEISELENLVKNGRDTETQRARVAIYEQRLKTIWDAYHVIEEAKWTKEVNDLLSKLKIAASDLGEEKVNQAETLMKAIEANFGKNSEDEDAIKDDVRQAVQVAEILDGFSKKKNRVEPDIEDIDFIEIVSPEFEEEQATKYDESQEKIEELKRKIKELSDELNKKTGGRAEKFTKRDVLIRLAIEELRTWPDINTLESKFVKVRTEIMTDPRRGTDDQTALSREAKSTYMALAVEAYMEARARLGKYKTDLDLKRYRGVSYSPEIALPLYEKQLIPITSKQMLDSSRINYLLKLGELIGKGFLFFNDDVEGKEQKVLGEVFARARKATKPVVGRAISRTAKKLGGKEAQLKAEKWTRFLFTSSESGLDDPQSKIKGATKVGSGTVKEDVASPGVAFQTPASIGGSGNPLAPTPTSLGSGDNFQPKKSKKSNKNIMDFSSFFKNLNKK